MPSIGWQELIVVLVIILVLVGPKRLPEMGRSLGRGISEFKNSSQAEALPDRQEQPDPSVEKVESAR